ncbi:UDP-glucose:2-hydroxyflavanone C-glucosyltransferase [Dichanthelium oligosanthes]|uniref:UDP-glucose:2-hydroxyflavanone C-glucosyltransferase n=1 Tax=Dichanthelium oligosanthes TaxID=888268 RepID=A0A1E5VSC4_9POAL|nr:UDP-glucose:2-hydroxyflavanone C-glucosyltransferase [Dichanthelium oligosanthes]
MAPPAMQSPGELSGGARPHVMFIPSAGMGHLLPFFRFIAALANHDVDISVVTVLPTVSAAEADHFARLFEAFPRVRRVDFHLLSLDASEFPDDDDPFCLRWEALRRSAHLLGPLIAGATPRVSAVITDVTLTSHVVPIAKELHVPCHVLFISCATMLSLLAYIRVHLDKKAEPGRGVGDVDIPGVRHIPQSYLPQSLLDLSKLFTKQFIDNGREIINADGCLVNTFEALEPVALAALRAGKVVPGFPPVYAIGPLKSHTSTANDKPETTSFPVAWLDEQPARSVVYIAFGNRNTVSRDQLREIAAGLEASSSRFLWVLKTTNVDRDDNAELTDVLGDGFLERVQGRGLVTKAWVDQEALLKHPSVGMFLSHSGWNSVTEAAAAGVPLLAWPRGGDHRVNATVVVSGGVGVWMELWRWDGEEKLVSGEEIGEKVKEVMSNVAVRARATRTGEVAAMAVAEGGTSYRSLQEFVGKLKAT